MRTKTSYKHTRLEELGSHKISEIDTEYDLRNFEVRDGHEKEIGRVIELLFDIQSKKLRYLVIELHSQNTDENLRQILAPIGTAELHEEEDYLYIPALNSDLINALPDYEKGSVNPGVENMVRLAYAGEDLLAEGSGLTGNDVLNEEEDFYSHLHFDLGKFFGRKKIEPLYVKTICGVFDDSLEVENTISDLIKEGFSQDEIEVSSCNQADGDSGIDENVNGGGSVVCIKIHDAEAAFRVSEIMNINGSVSVYETTD
ncbi:PRC-barrel domain-containing protein [Pedobacter sp. P351]|uniref:PRC-barrel domain-containing protein n=1 Tax=Pedobacter superstes TaxID=3133441 RepID=UPI003099786F